MFAIYCNLQELQHLPESEQYLFTNFSWKPHPAYNHCMEIQFSDEDQLDARGLYHELWKNRFHLPSLNRNWI